MNANETESAAAASSAKPLVRVESLSKFFTLGRGILRKSAVLRAIDAVSLDVKPSETLGLVGESGSGKTTLGKTILRLTAPSAGRIFFDGQDITALGTRALRPIRRRMQIVFQDPYSSLNPRMTVRATLAEAIRIHGLASSPADEQAQIEGLLDRVGLRPEVMHRYPHEFSGGQRQRIGIARALSVRPDFIVCDEPLSALDVSIQAQIVNLLLDLQERAKLSYLFISHDLKVVEYMSHRVAVMYLGKIVEFAPAAALYERRLHPYTRALMSAVPVADPSRKRLRILLEGDVPNPLDPPRGCPFHPRCSRRQPGVCDTDVPPLAEIEAGSGHRVACFYPYV